MPEHAGPLDYHITGTIDNHGEDGYRLATNVILTNETHVVDLSTFDFVVFEVQQVDGEGDPLPSVFARVRLDQLQGILQSLAIQRF